MSDGTLTALVEGKVDGNAIDPVAELLERHLEGQSPSAVGHRIVHGGADFLGPTPSTIVSSRRSKDSFLSIRFTSPGASAPSAPPAPAIPRRFTWPASTRRSTAATRTSPTSWPCPARSARPASAATDSTACPTSTSRRRLSELDPEVAKGRVVAAHLGYGASLCALRNGKSVDSTMTFTALDGLVMSTRPGSLDAGVVLWLLDRGWDRERIARLLWNESGLLALSEKSADLREILADERRPPGSPWTSSSTTAVKQAAAMAAALGGLDGLVFTAGIGENQPETRRRIADGLSFLGVALDEEANRRNDVRIGAPGARVATFVVPTDEEARHRAPHARGASQGESRP